MRDTIQGTKDEIEIDLQRLLLAYLSRWWLIVLCGALLATSAYVYTKQFITPLYRANVTIYVNNYRSGEKIESISGSNITASQQLVNTYINIIQSDTVLRDVVENSELTMSITDLRKTMSAAQEGETEIFKVFITHPDPEMAAKIANAVAEVAPAKIEEIVEGSSTKIIDYATTPDGQYSPNYQKNMMIGAVFGSMLALVYITVRYLMDVRIKDEDDLAQLFAYPILGQIPAFDQISTKKKSGYDPKRLATTRGENE